MKLFKISITLLLIMLLGGASFAQSVGELDRFNNESLETRNEVKLYPNPSVEFVNVVINNSDLEDVKFTVHNIIGNIVEVEVEEISENNFKIKVEDLPSGYYLVAIKDEGKHFRETYKFLKR